VREKSGNLFPGREHRLRALEKRLSQGRGGKGGEATQRREKELEKRKQGWGLGGGENGQR